MKLEKNMYVRSKINGRIGKITDIEEFEELGQIVKRYIVNNNYNLGFCSTEKDSVKASHDITDLIEPLDLLFIDIDPHDGHGGIVVPRVPETINEVKKYVDGIKKDEIRLVGIVTKEAIQSDCYWLEKGD